MNLKTEFNASTLLIAGLAALARRLDAIDRKLENAVPPWPVKEAVKAFRMHINETHKKPRNFDFVLAQFEQAFERRSITEITAHDIELFLSEKWGMAKKSTSNLRRDQVSLLFSYCITEMKKRGESAFMSPCELVKRQRGVAHKKNEYVSPEKILELLSTCEEEHHWLWMAIMASSGIRVGELLKLRAEDVSGRVLTLWWPKSGMEKETAVITSNTATRLHAYMRQKGIGAGEKLWPETHATSVNKMIRRHSSWVGLSLTNHSLRKWCATHYERAGDLGAARFVLRHHGSAGLTALEGRYIAPYSVAEACAAQDKHLGFL